MYRNSLLLFALLILPTLAQADWTRFRGPNGSGVSPETASTPVHWGPNENLTWKTELPGPGVSSPIVVGDRVFVTCYSGYGEDRANPGRMEDLKRHLVCADRQTGKVLWQKTVDAVQPEDEYREPGVTTHGYASHTPTSDGERVYVFFGKTGVLAFDVDGNQLWQTNVGQESDPRRWGSSSSPILHENLVIVTASAESEAMVALDKETGKEVWRQEASGLSNVWGTPTLVKVDEARTDLVVGVPYEVWGFNPETGKLRWYSEAPAGDQFSSSVVTDQGIAYGIEGRGGGTFALRAGGKGDVSKTHVVWTGRDTGRFGSPIVHDGKFYSHSNGVVTILNSEDGDRIAQFRLPGASGGGGGDAAGGRGGSGGGRGGGGRGGFGGGDYASPVMADGKMYIVRGSGEVAVLTVGEKLEQLAVNRLTEDSETFMATPAISDGQIFIRSDKYLYCVGGDQ